MSVNKYQMFLKTVECGSFSKAAEEMNFTQSAVSHAVQALENELGVTLQAPAPKGVYVKFTPKYPNVSFVEWSATNAYEAGDIVYMTTTKECYQAMENVSAGGTSPAADSENWVPLRISDTFESFLTRLVAVDFLTEDQGKYQTRAAADKEFDDLCERYHEGNGECRVRTGRFMR